jgi:hypothetical protein
VLLADGEAPAEARDRLDVAGEHGVGREIGSISNLPGALSAERTICVQPNIAAYPWAG